MVLLLLGSLIGSYFNIPIAALPPEQVESDKVIEFFGMEYTVPMVENLPGTVIAINVGGAVIPTIMSIYLLTSRRLWVSGAIATAIVAVVLHWPSPIRCPEFGIAVPIFVPALITAAVSLLLSRRDAAPLAYISGSMGTPDRRRPHQPGQGGGARRAGRFDRRGWHLRWDFSHRHPCGSTGRSLSAKPAGGATLGLMMRTAAVGILQKLRPCACRAG